jgi:hypothetical protein
MAVVVLLFFNSILLVYASLDQEFGVDHDKDKHDPAYKYKMRGIRSIQVFKYY